MTRRLVTALLLAASLLVRHPVGAAEPPTDVPARRPFFGCVHVHTSYSFDAFTNGSRTKPADAYAWAQGREMTNSGIGGPIKIAAPLDFYMVS